MIIKNGLVWEESGSFRKKELVVDTTTHRIAETAEDDTVFDAEGLYVIPGLVDVHIHGARGHDFSDGNSKGLAEIAQYLHSCGVTSFCPTSMTLPEEQLTAAFACVHAPLSILLSLSLSYSRERTPSGADKERFSF